MIQSDVEIHAGHSGGPLLDAHGNVVGMAVEGYGGADAGIGLNLFIPVEEALESLDITVAGDAPAGAPLPLMIQN
jgi:S1-C subfamily serine protease